jgi:hypothetical protein
MTLVKWCEGDSVRGWDQVDTYWAPMKSQVNGDPLSDLEEYYEEDSSFHPSNWGENTTKKTAPFIRQIEVISMLECPFLLSEQVHGPIILQKCSLTHLFCLLNLTRWTKPVGQKTKKMKERSRSAWLGASNLCSHTALSVTGGPLSLLTRSRAKNVLSLPRRRSRRQSMMLLAKKNPRIFFCIYLLPQDHFFQRYLDCQVLKLRTWSLNIVRIIQGHESLFQFQINM